MFCHLWKKKASESICFPIYVWIFISFCCVAGLVPDVFASTITPSLNRLTLDGGWHNGSYSSQGIDYAQQGAWVRPINIVEPSVEPSNEIADGIFHLLLDNQYQTADNGEFSQFKHYAIKAVSAKGLEYVSQISIDLDPSYERITFHGIKVYRDGIEIDKTLDSQFSLDRTDKANDLIYDGSLVAFWAINDIRIGDIVEYSFTRHGQNPVFNNIFSASKQLQWSVPVHQQYVRVLWGKNTPLQFKMHNTEQTFTQTRLGDQTDYELLITNQPKHKVSDDAAAWYDPYPRVQFSEIQNWQSVVDWALPLFERQVDNSAALQNKLAEIKQQSDDIEQQIMLALNFVQQDVRYLGIEIGSNSHFPAKASETILNRYGDCKDKSVLLIALLKGLGVKASPVLVNSNKGKALDTELPSARSFNHAIVKAQINQQTYWLDPTLLYQAAPLDALYQPNYGYALVLDKGVDRLEKMPDKQSGSAIHFSEHYDFSGGVDSQATFTSTVTMRGLEARSKRAQLVDYGVQGLTEQYASYYDKLFNGLTINQPLLIEDDINTGALSFTEDYLLNAPWSKKDDGGFTVYVYETQISPYLSAPEGLNERVLSLSYPLQIDGKMVLKLRQNNWQFDEETIEENNPFFKLVYSVSFDHKRQELTLSYDYQTKVDRVEVNQVKEYIGALKKVSSVGSYGIIDYLNIVPKKDSSPSTASSLPQIDNRQLGLIVILVALGLIYAVVSLIQETNRQDDAHFYPVSQFKFLVLTLFSLGLYPSYWSYKNWQYIRQAKDRPDIWPVARAIFSPLWYFALFSWLEVEGEQRGNRGSLIPKWAAFVLFICYLLWNSSHKIIDFGMFDELIPFFVFAPLLYYVNKLNPINSAAYVANSRWHARNTVLIACSAPLFIFVFAQQLGLTSKDDIVDGKALWSRDITFMQDNNVLARDEIPVLFYSDDWLSNQVDGNGFSERSVFSYWMEDDKLQVASSPFDQVKDIRVQYAESDADRNTTEITIQVEDGEEFILYATSTDEKDKVFVDRLMLEWRNHRPSVTAE